MTITGLSGEQRGALELLASSRNSANEELLIGGHGFSGVVLSSLARRSSRARSHAAGGNMIEVARVRITEAGRRAIEG